MSELYLPNGQKREKFLCLWLKEDGMFIANDDGVLCAESWTHSNKEVEDKMRSAARSLGVWTGEPKWIKGHKVTKEEREEQIEQLKRGENPDGLH